MGLDQYIYRELEDQKDEEGNNKLEKLYYWRKHYALNSWACDHWCDDLIGDFNCEKLYINEEQVDTIIEHILFNLKEYSEEDLNSFYEEPLETKDILEAFIDCKRRISEGQLIYYLAWW